MSFHFSISKFFDKEYNLYQISFQPQNVYKIFSLDKRQVRQVRTGCRQRGLLAPMLVSREQDRFGFFPRRIKILRRMGK